MFTCAILRTPGPNFADGLTTSNLGTPDYDLLLEQHQAYAETLAHLGLRIEILEALPNFPDAYFVEDVAVITPEVATIARPGALARRGEEEAMAGVLAKHHAIARIQHPGTLDGGDVLLVGRTLLIGLSNRTNAEGAAQLAGILGSHGYVCATIPVADGLHFKSSVTWVGGNTLLVSESFSKRAELQRYDLIVVEADEEYASNTLLVNGTLITPKGFPKTLRKLKSLGLPVVELDTSEARKMDGGLTCMSLRF